MCVCGGGGGTLIHVLLYIFWFIYLNYIIFWGVGGWGSEILIFWGYEDFVDIFSFFFGGGGGSRQNWTE